MFLISLRSWSSKNLQQHIYEWKCTFSPQTLFKFSILHFSSNTPTSMFLSVLHIYICESCFTISVSYPPYFCFNPPNPPYLFQSSKFVSILQILYISCTQPFVSLFLTHFLLSLDPLPSILQNRCSSSVARNDEPKSSRGEL